LSVSIPKGLVLVFLYLPGKQSMKNDSSQ